MLLILLALTGGLVLLLWSAERFVDGSAALARSYGLSPLLIGMVVVGFGTSAPEMLVSALSAAQGNPGLAMGNAWGSNITNIALILGLTALISPIQVHSAVLRRELPLLTAVTLGTGLLVLDGQISRLDAALLLLTFALLMVWTFVTGRTSPQDPLQKDMEENLSHNDLPRGKALLQTLLGLVLLILSSRVLVWGAVSLARTLGVDDLIIGLTLVALGTSLPELASSIIAARRGEHDLALGNILGSNLFNTLAVVGLAGLIHPLPVQEALRLRDWPVMLGLTAVLFLLGYGRRKQGRINRWEGLFLLLAFMAYTVHLILSTGS